MKDIEDSQDPKQDPQDEAADPSSDGPYEGFLDGASQTETYLRDTLLDVQTPPTDGALSNPQSSEVGDTNEAESFRPGLVLAERFRIVRWLASGGMGEVYEAIDLELGGAVAVKTLRPKIFSDSKALDRFRREISLARKVTHIGICRIFDVFYHHPEDGSSDAVIETPSPNRGSGSGTIFLTMELLDGPTFHQRLKESGPMTVEEARPWVFQMVEALSTAHEIGIVHRDFKTSNVNLSSDPRGGLRAVITDFGLALDTQLNGPAEGLTTQAAIVGSPAYMSPEQARGDDITPATDIYALGVVLFEMLTGRLPFSGSSGIALLAARLSEEAPSPKIHVPDIDPVWEAVILKCLARDPAQRFQEVREVADCLRSGGPPEIKPNRPSATLSRPVTMMAVLALVIFISVGLWRVRPTDESLVPPPAEAEISSVSDGSVSSPEEAPRRKSATVMGLRNLSGNPEHDWMATAISELLAGELGAGSQIRVTPGERVARMRLEMPELPLQGLAEDTLQMVGVYLDTDYVVSGSFLAGGEPGNAQLRLDLQLRETSRGELIGSFTETLPADHVLEIVTRLGRRLRDSLQLSVTGQGKGPAGNYAVLPSSSKALQLYSEGLAARRAFDLLTARRLFDEAIAEDPESPLAHASQARTLDELGLDTLALIHAERALELSENLPREEQATIEAEVYKLGSDWKKAARIYESLHELYPDNLEYGLELTRLQLQALDLDEMESTIQELRQLPGALAEDPRIDLEEGHLAFARQDYESSLNAAIAAETKARARQSRTLLASAQHDQATSLRRLGRSDEALEKIDQSHRILKDIGHSVGAANALGFRAILLAESHQYEAAIELSEETVATLRQAGDRPAMAKALNNLAMFRQFMGDFEGSLPVLEEGLALGREVGDQRSVVGTLFNIATAYLTLGQVEEARRNLLEARGIVGQLGNPSTTAMILSGLSQIYLSQGHLAKARREALEVVELLETKGNPPDRAVAEMRLAAIERLADKPEEAKRLIESAMTTWQEGSHQRNLPEAIYLLARLCFEGGDLNRALELAQQAESKFQDGRNLPTGKALEATIILARGDATSARQLMDEITSSLNDADLDSSSAVGMADAEILAAELQFDQAIADLQDLLQRVQTGSRKDLELQVVLKLALIEHAAGLESGATRLREVSEEAEELGFLLIARQARKALREEAS